ncbi:MAG TPA: class I SAM-dependent methyltransferase [Planctomycetota bacterium]|nr:class I SAM-dependent methyltransferase [Planctomycetota bacterium]
MNEQRDAPRANPQDDWRVNAERFTGFAGCYDSFRQHPPAVLPELLLQLAGVARAKLVADLGCGTGISTRVWAPHAEQVVGIDPSDDMLGYAAAIESSPNISYRKGLSHATGLPDACADVITCSQSLHWMDPAGTFAEAARVLRPGGVFAGYDCNWPPAIGCWQIDPAYRRLMDYAGKLAVRHGLTRGLKQWRKEEHIARMRNSGRFRYVTEVLLHSVESGNAERIVGLVLSQGIVAGLLKLGLTQAEIGVDDFRAFAQREMGSDTRPWFFSYRVRVGIV